VQNCPSDVQSGQILIAGTCSILVAYSLVYYVRRRSNPRVTVLVQRDVPEYTHQQGCLALAPGRLQVSHISLSVADSISEVCERQADSIFQSAAILMVSLQTADDKTLLYQV